MSQREANRLRRMVFLGRHATGLSLLVAGLSFLIVIAVAFVMIFQSAIDSDAQSQLAVARKVEAVSRDAGSLLIDLAKSADTRCTRANLFEIKRLIFLHHYVRSVGIYNEHGQLYCTTQMGALPTPFEQPWTSFVTRKGFEVHLKVPALLFKGKETLTVVRYGRFDVVLNPDITREVLDRYPGVIWFVGHGLTPLWNNSSYPPGLLERMRRDATITHAGVRYDWPTLSADVIRPIPHDGYVFDGNLVFESHLTLARALAGSPVLVMLSFAIAFVLGVLLLAALAPWVRQFDTLAYKIRYLCTEEHILCLYQPILNLRTGKMVGCEVLMRLFDDEGMYFPDQTISAIEAAGLTWQLDRAVTAKALRELSSFLQGKEGFRVSFNFFPGDIKDSERLLAHFNELHDKHHARRFRIAIEILEHSISDDEVAAAIARLRAAGYCVAVDDFGTGYSNLGSLKKVMPDILKIDRTFVFDMEDTSVRSSLIPEIVAIAHAVDANVVAEGIENEAQVAKLIAMGVDHGQGNHYSKPVPIKEFVALPYAFGDGR